MTAKLTLASWKWTRTWRKRTKTRSSPFTARATGTQAEVNKPHMTVYGFLVRKKHTPSETTPFWLCRGWYILTDAKEAIAPTCLSNESSFQWRATSCWEREVTGTGAFALFCFCDQPKSRRGVNFPIQCALNHTLDWINRNIRDGCWIKHRSRKGASSFAFSGGNKYPASKRESVHKKMAGSDPVFPARIHAGDGLELLGSHPELRRWRLRLYQVWHRRLGAVGPAGLRPLAAVYVVTG